MLVSIARKMTTGIFLDLETCILGTVPNALPGKKRFHTRMIEIGAVAMDSNQEPESYNVLVAPINVRDIKTPRDVICALEGIHQHPWRTLSFWTRVLVQRGDIHRNHNLYSNLQQAEKLLDLMLASAADFDEYVSKHPEPKALEEKRKWAYECPVKILPERIALLGLEHFSGLHGGVWYAHNGNSFDFKVLEGAYKRCQMPWKRSSRDSIDTIPLFKKWTGKLYPSYSQPKLYSQLFKEKYSAHIALADAIALRRLYHHLKGTPQPIKKRVRFKEKPEIVQDTSTNVRSIKGVGPKTQAMWADMGIRTVKELKKACKGDLQWLKTNTPSRVSYKRIYDQLYT